MDSNTKDPTITSIQFIQDCFTPFVDIVSTAFNPDVKVRFILIGVYEDPHSKVPKASFVMGSSQEAKPAVVLPDSFVEAAIDALKETMMSVPTEDVSTFFEKNPDGVN